ncbi:hypothetical protein JL722_9927 [Aureococcus anophagefferens]|nr:hypothetical protein JL722_9927 [Aureococcus anophagefferens]
MAKDKASTRKPRRRNARARDDGGTRRATEATPPVRASKRLSVQVSAAASAFLVNFRLGSTRSRRFVNYHEERQEFVAKTEAADLIEQNVAEMMGSLQFDFVLMLCRRLGVKGVFLFATEAGAPAWLTLGFEHVGSSASLIHLRFDLLFKRDRGVLARSARGPGVAPRSCSMDARSRSSATPRASTPWSAVQERVAEYGEKQVVRLAKEAANAAARPRPRTTTRPGAARTCRSTTCSRRRRRRAPRRPGAAGGAVAVGARGRVVVAAARGARAGVARGRGPSRPRRRRRRRAAAPPRQKRVVDDADADDEDEAWEPGRPSMMDLGDDEQEQARRPSASSSGAGPGPGRGGRAAPRPLPKIRVFPQLSEVQKARLRMKDQEHIRRRGSTAVTQEQERNAFLERIQAEERRGFEESDNDDPVEDLIHRERIRERDLLRTPGCLALGREAFRVEDMPRVTERDREILRRLLYILREAERRLQRLFPNLDFRLSWSVRFNVVVQTIDAIALDSNFELTRVDMEVRRSTVGVYEDSLACQLLGQTYYVHPDKTIKITVDLVVTSEVIGAFQRRGAVVRAREIVSLAGTAPGRAEVQIKELGFHFIDPLAPIAEKEIVRASALDDGHLIVELKYLQAMHVKNRMLKKCCYTLYLLELADRLRGEASRETLKTARKNVVELDMALLARPTLAGVIRKFANAIARKAAEARGETFVPTPYDETAVDAVVVTAVPPVAPVVAPEPAPPAVSAPAGPPLKALEAMSFKECTAELDAAGVPKKGRGQSGNSIAAVRDLATLVADGAKKVEFKYGTKGKNGSDYLVARWRGLAETDPLRLEFDELAARRVAAAADELPVDRLQRAPDPGLVNLPTIWPRMRFPSASRLRQRRRLFQRSGMCYRVIRDAKRRVGAHPPRAEDDQCPAYYGVDYRTAHGKPCAVYTEALRSLENAFSEFMPVSIQEKHRISEVVVARFEEVNVARAEAEKPLPPLHTAASTAAVANFYRDPCGLLEPRALAPPGQPRRVAKLYVVPNCEVVSPPPPPIYHVTENGERLLVLYATRVQRPLIPAIQQVHKQRAEFLSLFDESEVEMAAAMFDSRPIEIARPLLFESEEDAERRAEPAAPKRKRKSRKKKRKAAAAAAAAAAAEPAARRRRRRRASGRAEAPAEAPAASPPTAPPVEAPAEAPPAAAPAKKKKKKRSRRRPRRPPRSASTRARMRNIAAGNKKLYSLGLIHPPPEVVADPEHSWWSERARTRVFLASRPRRALPQAQS